MSMVSIAWLVLKNKMAATAIFLLTQNIDDVRFLKNKMAATANFLLTQNIDDVRSIKGKVMNISSPNVVYGYKVS